MTDEDILNHVRDCRGCGHPIYLTGPFRLKAIYGNPKLTFMRPQEFVRIGELYGREIFVPSFLYKKYAKRNQKTSNRTDAHTDKVSDAK